MMPEVSVPPMSMTRMANNDKQYHFACKWHWTIGKKPILLISTETNCSLLTKEPESRIFLRTFEQNIKMELLGLSGVVQRLIHEKKNLKSDLAIRLADWATHFTDLSTHLPILATNIPDLATHLPSLAMLPPQLSLPNTWLPSFWHSKPYFHRKNGCFLHAKGRHKQMKRRWTSTWCYESTCPNVKHRCHQHLAKG